MSSASNLLRDFPGDTVEIACDRCGRHGRYGKARLIDQHGGNKRLPDVLTLIVSEAGCEHWGQRLTGQGCAPYYPQLGTAPEIA